MKKQAINIIGQVVGISLSVFVLSFVVFAAGWVGPTDVPPAGNLSAPLNSGSESQLKEGALSVGGVFEALGIVVNPEGAAIPTCSESTRGMMWTERGLSGEQDVLYFCGKHADDTYDWKAYASMWKSITAVGGDDVYTFVGDGSIGIAGVTYRVHKFTTVGSSSLNVTDAGTDGAVEYLVVAGGGSGGTNGGGSGAGGLIYEAAHVVSSQVHTVTVGAGGTGGLYPYAGNNGGNSVFDSLTAIGGGRGGSQGVGQSGGSGGGGGYQNYAGGSGTASQGNAGVAATGATLGYYGGGGGAGAVASGMNGGAGLQYSISGSVTYYAGGGGGGRQSGSPAGAGGVGGGGDGNIISEAASHATANTGGGGGGSAGGPGISGNGGSGIVIIRYPITNPN